MDSHGQLGLGDVPDHLSALPAGGRTPLAHGAKAVNVVLNICPIRKGTTYDGQECRSAPEPTWDPTWEENGMTDNNTSRKATSRRLSRFAASTLVGAAFVLLPLAALAAPQDGIDAAPTERPASYAALGPVEVGPAVQAVAPTSDADSVAKASTVPDGFSLVNESGGSGLEGSSIVHEQRFRTGAWEDGTRASITITTVSGAFDAQHEFAAYPSARNLKINGSDAVISYTAPDDDGLIIIRWALTEDRNVLVVGRGAVDEATLIAFAEGVVKEVQR